VCAALIATVYDVPATSKLGGFLWYESKRGSWKYSKEFPLYKDLNSVKFCNAEVGLPRSQRQHKEDTIAATSAATPTERKKMELQCHNVEAGLQN